VQAALQVVPHLGVDQLEGLGPAPSPADVLGRKRLSGPGLTAWSRLLEEARTL
jgi:hypothetical protein